jgi:regulator of replication initiation timing
MSLISKIKELFAEEVTPVEAVENESQLSFIDLKTMDGMILRISDLAVDGTVMEISEEGEVAVEDGTYTLEDETQIVVVGGVITEVIEAAPAEEVPAEAPVAEEMEEVTEVFMDVTLKDGPIAHVVTATEGEINAGDKMMIEGVEAGPGEYYTADGKEIIVGEMGVIMEVKEAEAEEPEAEEAPEAQTADEEVQGVVNNLKNLINQIKDLKSQFEEVKSLVQNLEKENKELKEEVSKFAEAPSAEPTKTKVEFNKASKEDKLKFYGKR